MVILILTLIGAVALAQDKPETKMIEKHECMKDLSSCSAKHKSRREMKMEESKETVGCSAVE